jgi:phosphoglycolate phosphatase
MVTEQRSSETGADRRSHADWLLGDTGHDINVGKALGLHTCAVLSGFLSHASLLPYGAECILASVADFKLPA